MTENNNNNYNKNIKYAKSIEAEKVVSLHKRIGSELIGTFALVFAAAGSDISDALGAHELGKFAVAVVPGLIIMAMIYVFDKISGAYFNPAKSIGFTITQHLKLKELPLYVIAQIAGSIIASLVVLVAVGHSGNSGLTLPLGKGGWLQAFVLEIVLTFFL
jgi:glycerol uptake facilitator-like aquaporin